MWHHAATSHAATIDGADAVPVRARNVTLSETNANDNHVEGDGDDGHNLSKDSQQNDTKFQWTLGTDHIEDNILPSRLRDEAGQSSDKRHRVQETRIDDDLEQGAQLTSSWPDVGNTLVDAPDTVGQENGSEQIGGESGSIEGCNPLSGNTSKDVARCRLGMCKTVDAANTGGYKDQNLVVSLR